MISLLLKKSITSILAPVLGVIFWIGSFFLLIHVVPNLGRVGSILVFLLWFFLPLLFSLFGIYAGYTYIKINGVKLIVSLGIIFNAICLLLFVLLAYLVFAGRISA